MIQCGGDNGVAAPQLHRKPATHGIRALKEFHGSYAEGPAEAPDPGPENEEAVLGRGAPSRERHASEGRGELALDFFGGLAEDSTRRFCGPADFRGKRSQP